MEPPEGFKGEVLLLSGLFGAMAENALGRPVDEVFENQDWVEELAVEGGPFCWTEEEREIPF